MEQSGHGGLTASPRDASVAHQAPHGTVWNWGTPADDLIIMTKQSSTSSQQGSNNNKTSKSMPYSNKVFEGSHIQMKGSYYTYDPEQQAVDQFQETTNKLIEVVCSSFK